MPSFTSTASTNLSDKHSPAPATHVLPTARCGVDIGAAKIAEMRGSYEGMASTQRDLKHISHADVKNETEVKLLLISTREELLLLRKQLARDRAISAQFERQCAPILRGLELNLIMLRQVHERARQGHARGINVLKQEFDYIPHFRHEKSGVRFESKKLGWIKTDEAFKATAFVPKRL